VKHRPDEGFALMSALVALILLTLLAGAASAVSVRLRSGNLRLQTTEQLRALLTAMRGDPERGHFGYLGDMGELPDTDLQQLFMLGSQTAGTAHSIDGVTSGFAGPYVRTAANPASPVRDSWGSALRYTPGIAQLTSLGPDRTLGTADDIVVPSLPPLSAGNITVLVRGLPSAGGPAQRMRSDEASVQVFYTRSSDNTRAAASVSYLGAQGSGQWSTDAPVHLGRHGVQVTGLDASGSGGRNYSGSLARDIVALSSGAAYVEILLEES